MGYPYPGQSGCPILAGADSQLGQEHPPRQDLEQDLGQGQSHDQGYPLQKGPLYNQRSKKAPGIGDEGISPPVDRHTPVKT